MQFAAGDVAHPHPPVPTPPSQRRPSTRPRPPHARFLCLVHFLCFPLPLSFFARSVFPPLAIRFSTFLRVSQSSSPPRPRRATAVFLSYTVSRFLVPVKSHGRCTGAHLQTFAYLRFKRPPFLPASPPPVPPRPAVPSTVYTQPFPPPFFIDSVSPAFLAADTAPRCSFADPRSVPLPRRVSVLFPARRRLRSPRRSRGALPFFRPSRPFSFFRCIVIYSFNAALRGMPRINYRVHLMTRIRGESDYRARDDRDRAPRAFEEMGARGNWRIQFWCSLFLFLSFSLSGPIFFSFPSGFSRSSERKMRAFGGKFVIVRLVSRWPPRGRLSLINPVSARRYVNAAAQIIISSVVSGALFL